MLWQNIEVGISRAQGTIRAVCIIGEQQEIRANEETNNNHSISKEYSSFITNVGSITSSSTTSSSSSPLLF